MSSQTSLTTRRQFLNRSAWGFGSAFILPSLLQSCMQDHNLPGPDPNPNTPVILPPTLGETEGDEWNNGMRSVVLTGLGLIPDVGGLVSAIVSVMWPSDGNSAWDQVKDQVNALIAQANQTLLLNTQQAYIDETKQKLYNFHKYLSVVTDKDEWATVTWPLDPNNKDLASDLADVKTYWDQADDNFTTALPFFQLKDYEAVLLPLFAQFANLYLAFYRDALAPARNSLGQPFRDQNYNLVPNGKIWGLSDTTLTRIQDLLTAATALTADPTNDKAAFAPYVTKWYTSQLATLQQVKFDPVKNEPFRTTNAYTRTITMYVLDYMDTWQYYNIVKYPNGATTPDGTPIPLFTREIYSDPAGNTAVGNAPPRSIVLPSSQATQLPTNITVWSGNKIDAVQLTYPWAGGPNGLNQTPRLGDQKGGVIQGLVQPTLTNPITKVAVTADWEDSDNGQNPIPTMQGIDTMYFVYNDGAVSNTFGGKAGQFTTGEITYTGYALSSIYIQGSVWLYDNTANCIVFGFLRWAPPSESLKAVTRVYITNPREISGDELARAFPKLGLSAGSISDGLKASRKTYWDKLKARAK